MNPNLVKIFWAVAIIAAIVVVVAVAKAGVKKFSSFVGLPSVWTQHFPMASDEKEMFKRSFGRVQLRTLSIDYLVNVMGIQPYRSARLERVTELEPGAYDMVFFIWNPVIQAQPTEKHVNARVIFGYETSQGESRPFVQDMVFAAGSPSHA